MMKYEIYEGNMNRLEKHMKRIAKKCDKYGCDFHYEIVGEVFKDFEETEDANGNRCEPYTVTRRFVVIEVEGKAIVNDWRFIGSIEATENGNIFHKTVDVEIPERYYDAKPACEHCNTKRYRKYTYIIQNEVTGEFKQVGKTCLNDFTNGMDADFIASYYSMFEKLAEFETPETGCGYAQRYYPTMDMLAYAVAVANIYGYVRSNENHSTAETVKDFYGMEHGWFTSPFMAEIRAELRKEMDRVSFKVTDADYDTAQEIINHVANISDNNNYIHNLKVLCANTMVGYGNINMLVSAVVCWNHELERRERVAKREAEQADLKKSIYLGEINDRMTFEIESWKALTSWETMYGITVLYRFIDINGNVIIWKSSKYIDSEKEIKKLTGTVKEHKDFNGVKQTIVTRCKVA